MKIGRVMILKMLNLINGLFRRIFKKGMCLSNHRNIHMGLPVNLI